ncbi:MAG: hypothetical protein M3357_04905 [Actinomycetota bacterium]|nr:hypothetical protein [Actinomycetota bacterium]
MNPITILCGAVAALALVTMSPAPASAHTAGKVQLWLDRIALHSDGGRDWTVSVDLVDADSGSPEAGFDVTVEGSADAGHSLAPVALSDAGRGRYTGTLAVDSGNWSLMVRAQSRPGGEAAIPLQKAQTLVLQPGKDVAIGSASPAAAGSGGAAGPALNVKIERADRQGRTALWLPVRVTVTEGDAGAPPSADHVVFAAARNDRGDEAGPFELGTLELEGQRGVHEGFVIVSYGGTWTIDVAINDARAEPGAADALLGRGTAELVVDAPVPPAGAAAAAGSGDSPEGEPIGVAVLWVHTMLAILWGIAVAVLALLAVPRGRRFLSEYGTTLLDGRLDKIVRTAWWLTGLVVATGVYNLVESVAYRVPLSPDQATRLFRLPYAEPYYLTLAVKLAAYAVMICVSVPLIREARRRAATAVAGPTPTVVLDDDPSPWENPQRRAEADQGSGGRVALRRRTVAADVAVENVWALDDRAGRPASRLVAIMAAGGVVIIAAVTLLKYFHLMSEVSRLAG